MCVWPGIGWNSQVIVVQKDASLSDYITSLRSGSPASTIINRPQGQSRVGRGSGHPFALRGHHTDFGRGSQTVQQCFVRPSCCHSAVLTQCRADLRPDTRHSGRMGCEDVKTVRSSKRCRILLERSALTSSNRCLN